MLLKCRVVHHRSSEFFGFSELGRLGDSAIATAGNPEKRNNFEPPCIFIQAYRVLIVRSEIAQHLFDRRPKYLLRGLIDIPYIAPLWQQYASWLTCYLHPYKDLSAQAYDSKSLFQLCDQFCVLISIPANNHPHILQGVPKLPAMEGFPWSDRKMVCIFVITVVGNGGPAPF